ncbi:GPP34 family phosphoprotein [Actinosynnema sp. NPDC020468]|uniref:GOLPH3/VPS74 family protein n=1 Tax=Actinosynnema sp. NPDC020468 TaxID=3154488 RepID=UPI00340EDC2E
MSDLTLADELALLAYDDDGTRKLGQPNFGFGLAGAVLVELTLAGRIDVVDKHVTVTNPAPTGNPVLDLALTRIGDDKPRRPKAWVDKLSKGLPDQVLTGLVDAGVLRREEDRVLLLFPRTRYPAPDGVQPPQETDARERLTRAVTGDDPVDERTAALASLVRSVQYDRKVFKDLPRAEVKARLKKISEGDWASEATRKAIEQVQAAIISTTIAASAAASG